MVANGMALLDKSVSHARSLSVPADMVANGMALLEEKTPEERAAEKAKRQELNRRPEHSDEEEEEEEDEEEEEEEEEIKGKLEEAAEEDAPDFWVPEWSDEARNLRRKLGVDSPG
eukprot:6188703-Pyramimonas_sp.AAC.1